MAHQVGLGACLHRPRRGFGPLRGGPETAPRGDGRPPRGAGRGLSGRGLHRRPGIEPLAPGRAQDGPELLPPAEIRFDAYPPGKVRVVGYRSKWEEGTFEFANTPRTFEFPAQDAPLLANLKELALRCWKLFDLRGYARVDFRVDGEGRPWILEVNANPCLSPDAGFSAATLRAGLTFPDVLCRILEQEDNEVTCNMFKPLILLTFPTFS